MSNTSFTSNTTLYAQWKPNPYPYKLPEPITLDGVTATVTGAPSSPADYESDVTLTVTLTGTGEKGGDHLIKLSSAKGELNEVEKTITVGRGVDAGTLADGGNTMTARIKMPLNGLAKEDFTFSHQVVMTLKDIYDEEYTYTSQSIPYTLIGTYPGVENGKPTILYKPADELGGEYSDQSPVDAGTYDVELTFSAMDGYLLRHAGADGADTVANEIVMEKKLVILPKELTWVTTGLTPPVKEYDGNSSIRVTGTLDIEGVFDSDQGQVALKKSDGTSAPTFSGTAEGDYLTGKFPNNLPALSAEVTITDAKDKVVLTGDKAKNYTLPTQLPVVPGGRINGVEPTVQVIVRTPEPVTFDGSIQQADKAEGKSVVDFYNESWVKLDGEGEGGDTPEDFNVQYVYYTDESCVTPTTKANSGAEKSGGPPRNAGTYYI